MELPNLLFVPKHPRHLRLEVGDDERVDLGEARPLEQLVHLAHRGVAGEAAEVGEEVILLCAEEVGVLDPLFVKRLVPERPNVPGERG